MELKEVEVGMAVTYEAEDPELKQHGIIKGVKSHSHVWVVYNCDGMWLLYHMFTAEETHITNLVKGWV